MGCRKGIDNMKEYKVIMVTEYTIMANSIAEADEVADNNIYYKNLPSQAECDDIYVHAVINKED